MVPFGLPLRQKVPAGFLPRIVLLLCEPWLRYFSCRLISKFLSATNSSLGSISTLFQIFVNKFAVKSRKSLCRVNINLPFLQLIPC